MWRLALLLLFVYGCTEAPASDSMAARRAARIAAAKDALSKTPQPRSFRFDGNELRVIEVPVDAGNGYVGIQRCFVWRDAEFRSASIQCPSDATDVDIGRSPESEVNP